MGRVTPYSRFARDQPVCPRYLRICASNFAGAFFSCQCDGATRSKEQVMLELCGSESRVAKKGRRAWWPGKGSAGFVMAIATVVAFWSAQMQAQPWMNTA